MKIQDGSSGFQHRRLPSRPVEFHHQSPTGACPAFAGSYLPVVTGITECRTGYLYRELARTPIGAGGDSTAFATARNPATMVTFPAPATSNAACGSPATNVIEHICRGKTAHRVRREGTADCRFLPLSFGSGLPTS